MAKWIFKVNEKFNHIIYFFGLPAPLIDGEDKFKVRDVILLFNRELKEVCTSNNWKYLDTYSLTSNDEGLSNGLFHCDDTHLDYRILEHLKF